MIARHAYALSLCLALLCLLGGCAQEKPAQPQPLPSSPDTVSDATLVAYLRDQLEQEHIQLAPAHSYTDYSDPQEYKAQQRHLWTLWREANAPRLSSVAWQVDAPSPLLWSLPQGEQMQLRLLSKGTKPAGGYPFFINLHGGGSYPSEPGAWTSTINQEEWYALLSFTDSYPNSPALYFVPRMADDRKGRWHYAPQRVAFRRAIQLAILRGDADPDRIYLTGISEGGYGAFRLALYMPDYFAAVGPLAAAIDRLELAENLRNLPFRVDVGEYDYAYDRSLHAMDWRDKLLELARASSGDFVHEVNILSGLGHAIPYFSITSWLAGYSRQVHPQHVSYTYYAIDDGFSDGVYYLGFGGIKASADVRLHFDVQQQGNSFTLQSQLLRGSAQGSYTLYIDQVDFAKPIRVWHNGQEIFHGMLRPSKGVMAESLARFGDPRRIFPAKLTIPL